MVTMALAMLAAVGGSHCTSVTDEAVEAGHRPPYVLDQLSIRTGRYVVEFTYQVHRDVAHFSPSALALLSRLARSAVSRRRSGADLLTDGGGDLLGPSDDRVDLVHLGDHLQTG